MATRHEYSTPAFEASEAAAYASLFESAPAEWRLTVERQDEITGLFAPLYGSSFYNRVIGLGAGQPADRRDIQGWMQRFTSRGIARFSFSIPQYAQPAGLVPLLRSFHMDPGQRLLRMIRKAEGIEDPPTSLRIEQVGPEHAAEFSRILCGVFEGIECKFPLMKHSFGVEGWVHWLAFDGDIPAAASALFIQRPIAWMGFTATLPAFRGRGAQSAFIARKVSAAAQHGSEWIVDEVEPDTPERRNPSYHNMVRFGFHPLYERVEYTYAPSSVTKRLRKTLRAFARRLKPAPS